MIRVQVSVPFPAAMIDRVKDPFALPPLPLGALGFLQTGLWMPVEQFVGFFGLLSGPDWSPPCLGYYGPRRYVRWLIGGGLLGSEVC